MHIGFITPEYPHKSLPAAGGLGTSIKNLATALVEEGVEVSIFVVGLSHSRTFKEDQINFYFIKKYKVPGITWFFTRKYYQNYINKIIVATGIDLLEAPDWTGITAFMNFEVPLVLRLHGSDAYFCYLEGRKQKWKNYWFEKNALINADAHLSVSNFTGKITKKIFKLDIEVVTIYNSVDIKAFSPSVVSVEENTILYFGTIIRKKGVFELAKAFNILKRKNPDIVIKLIGKDSKDIFNGESSLAIIYKLIDPSFLKDISYCAHMPYEEIKAEIEKAHVVVLPSFAEAFPMTWLEAMAMEKAMLTSNIGWAREVMIDGETGFMVDPKDHQKFADKISILFNNEDINKTFGKNARNRVINNFSSKIITSKNIQYYKSFLK